MTRNTPEAITELQPGEVFVFGSNADGLHWGGAARVAHQHFGAEWGVGEGLAGQSYAIPTMGSPVELEAAVGRFLEFAREHAGLIFLVTKIGTGIAGRPVSEVAPFFAGAAANVLLPVEFESYR